MRDTLLAWISERQDRLRALDEQRRELEIEIRSFQAAILLHDEEVASDARGAPRAASYASRGPIARHRSISERWKEVLVHVGRVVPEREPNANTFSLSDVQEACEALGHPVSPENVRSQMATYVIRGIVSRAKPGEFQFTAAAVNELGSVPIALTASPADAVVGGSTEQEEEAPAITAQL